MKNNIENMKRTSNTKRNRMLTKDDKKQHKMLRKLIQGGRGGRFEEVENSNMQYC